MIYIYFFGKEFISFFLFKYNKSFSTMLIIFLLISEINNKKIFIINL